MKTGNGSHHFLSHRPRLHETVIRGVLFSCAGVSILITAGIVFFLTKESLLFFSDEAVSLRDFFTGFYWQPMIGRFGLLPLLVSTIITSLTAMCVAAPLGLLIAIYLSEYATLKVKQIIKPILEVLSGIPTVVYGYFALTTMTPALRSVFGNNTVEIYNMASAGLVTGILILPLVASMTEDAMSSVPRQLRDAAYGLGATKIEATLGIVFPAAVSGISAALLIAFSRAVGETMIVALAAGAGAKLTFNPFEGAETITGYIVRISGGDIGYNTMDYNSIFALGLLLFCITFILNIVSRIIVRRLSSPK